MRKLGFAFGLFWCLSALGELHAQPVTFTVQASASGTLGGTPFNTIVTVTSTADVSQITHPSAGFYSVYHTLTTIFVPGIGSATFVNPTMNFVNQNGSNGPGAGGTDLVTGDILDILSPSFATYDLSTSIGPVAGTALAGNNNPYATSRGDLHWSATGNIETGTFQAVVQPVPEPGSLMLLTAAMTVLAGPVIRPLVNRGRWSTRCLS